MKSNRIFWGLRPWKRHGKILTGAGISYALIGVVFALGRQNHNRDISLQAVLFIAPIQFWGAVFITAGALAIISSRWPPFADTWGYVVLTGLSAGWGAAYLAGMVFFKTPLTNVSGLLVWWLLGFLWWGISGLTNPHRPGEERPDGSD